MVLESGRWFNDVGDVNVVDGVGALGAIDGVVDVGSGINGVFNGVVNNVVDGVSDQETPPFENVGISGQTPPIVEVDTPNISFGSGTNSGNSYLTNSLCDTTHVSENYESANSILKDIRIKNVNRLIIGTLNINFIAPKFEQLKEVIGNHLDIFTIL